ncbi:MAG: NADH-quinone oxidoreductase subunit N [Halopseudomonas sp.]
MNSTELGTHNLTAAPIGADGLFSLLPLLLISALVVLQLLQISFRRDADLCYRLTLCGLIAALGSLFALFDHLPQQATPLLLIDHYSLFFMGLILACAILLLPLCHAYWRHRQLQLDEFYLLFTLSILGALVLVCSQHFASFVLGLELMSLSLVAMIGYPFTARYDYPLEAAIKYLLLSGVASATLLFGIALIYADLGSLGFASLSQTLSHTLIDTLLLQEPLLVTGIMLVLAGIGFKLSLVPFHLWTPDVYQGAPTPVTALLATISKAAVAALLLRWYLVSNGYAVPQLVWTLTLIAVASMLVGNLLALLQQDIKRLMAYSSIAHFGYLLVALLALSHASNPDLVVEAVSYYLVAYLISTLAVFAVIMQLGSEPNPSERTDLEHYQGLFWRRPLLALTLTLGLLSLAGIPLTVGFIGKFYIFTIAVEQQLWLLLLTLVIASGIGLFYYLRLILLMTYSNTPPDSVTNDNHTQPWHSGSGLTLISLALLTLLLGTLPTPLIELVRSLATAVG